MAKRKRKIEVTEVEAAEFHRMLADYNAAILRLPPNWRDIAERKAKLPASWDEAGRPNSAGALTRGGDGEWTN